jgi:hypothetical protein
MVLGEGLIYYLNDSPGFVKRFSILLSNFISYSWDMKRELLLHEM